MNNFARKSLTAVSIVALAFTPIAVTSQTVGVSSAVRNNVKVKETAQAQALQAVLKQRVKLGNAITTGANSGLQVTLLDKSTLTLGPNARMTVDRFVYDPAKRSSSVGTTVAKGTFRFLSGKPAKGGRNGITTPAASIGIRGTIVEGAVGQDAIDIASQQPGLSLAGSNPETATLVVLRGPGPGAQLGEQQGAIDVTAGGQTVTITTPGQAVFIPFAGAPPSAPFQTSGNSFQMFDQVLRTAPQSFTAANPTPGQQPTQQPGQQPAQQPAQQPGQQPQNPGGNPGSTSTQTTGSGPSGGSGGAGGGGGFGGGAAGGGAGGGLGGLGGLLGALGAAGLAGFAASGGGGDDTPASP